MMALIDFATSGHDKNLAEICEVEKETLSRFLKIPDGMSEEEFYDMHCPPLPPNFEPQKDEPYGVEQILDQREFKKRARAEYTEKDWRMHRWAYAKLTELVDSQIAKVLDAVKEAGIENETVIIFTSDHGDMDSAHRMEHKEVLYEESIKVPFIINSPGVTSGSVDSSHVISTGLDLVPTICDYAGVKPPEDIAGLSIKPVVEGQDDSWREFVPVEGTFGHAIVSARYKYIMHDEGEFKEQLVDLENNPYEMINSACLPENKDVLEQYRSWFNDIPKIIPRRGYYDNIK